MKKSSVLYSISCSCVLAILLAGVISSAFYNSCLVNDTYAKVPIATGGNGNTATASLSLTNPSMTSSAVTPGSIAEVSTNVTVDVANAESYSLTISVDNTNLTNGNTTLTPGNPNDSSKNNVWGYKWDNAGVYTAPSTMAQTLTTPTLANNATNFTKTLTFGAKFGSDANSGTYHGSGVLNLVATPKLVNNLSSIDTMQKMTPEICAASEIGDSNTLIDTRDNKSYLVRKLADQRCWMVQNLQLDAKVNLASITVDNTDITTLQTLKNNTIYLSNGSDGWDNSDVEFRQTNGQPTVIKSGSYDEKYGYYYSFALATAGTAVTSGDAEASICPKGWQIPKGGSDGDYKALYDVYYNNQSGGVLLGAADESQGGAMFWQGGYMYKDGLNTGGSNGYYWSRTGEGTVNGYKFAYVLWTRNGYTLPAISYDGYGLNNAWRYGRSLRCIARN